MPAEDKGQASEHILFNALDALKLGDVKPWVDMFDDRGIMEFPYAPPGFPARLDGKAAIADYMRAYPDHVSIERVHRRDVHHCGDVMIAEFTCEAIAVPTGSRFEMSYVGILTMREGKVALYRDYWNPLVALQAMGGNDALLAVANERAGA